MRPQQCEVCCADQELIPDPKIFLQEPPLWPPLSAIQQLRQRHHDACLIARQDFLTVEVAAVGNGIERINLQNCLRLLGNIRELRTVRAHIRYLVCHDQMMLGINRNLHVVTQNARATATCGHRSQVRIGERDLLIR
jgi:hypothetical protein